MRALRAVFALATLVVLLAGAPLALVRWGGDLGALSELDQTWVSDRGIFALLTMALWLVWAFFVASVAAELIATCRGVPTATIFLARPIQRIVAGLVGALLLTGSAAQGSAVDRLPPRPPPAIEAVVTDTQPPPAQSASPANSPSAPTGQTELAPTGEPSVVVVERGDTAWGIAEDHLGDGRRWREIWTCNQGTVQPDGRRWTDPQFIAAGWRLVLPGTTANPTGRTYVVTAGDSLSSIAATRLGDADRAVELFDLNRDRPQPDGGALSDPDLIQPGWTLRLPATAAPAPPPPPPPPPPTSPPSQERPPDDGPPPPPPTETRDPATTSAPSPGPDDRDVGTADGSSSNLIAWLSSGGVLVLATALAMRVRRRWRRQVSRDPTAPAAGPASEPQVAVVAAADVPLVQWAGQALAGLIETLDPTCVTGGPVLIELGDEAGIELLWDTPQHGPPAPWAETDDGWTWRLPYDAEAAVPPDALPAAIPALVTVGHRQGRQLLLDLEAYGTINVEGPDDLVGQWLRAIAWELAAGEDLSDADVFVVGDDPGVDLERLRSGDSREQAGAEIERWLARSRDSLASGGWADTFLARAAAPVPGEVGVVILVNDDQSGIGRAAVPRRRGVAVVGRNIDDAEARITIDKDGTARLDPLGIEFTPGGLTSDVADAVRKVLIDDESPDESEDAGQERLPVDVAADIVRAAADPDPDEQPEPDPAERPPLLVVRLLGVPSVDDRPGLGRREVVITSFLACRGGPVAASAVQDAVWGGKPIEAKTLWNIIGKTRRALGELPDGRPVMPSADRAQGTLSLADGVVTDLGLMRRAVREAEISSSARARELLRDALELVHGPPFDGPGYDWAFSAQLVHEAGMLIEAAAEQLVDLALEQGDLNGARAAITQGLRGLPGNESLYRLRMRIEAAGSNLASVKAAYDELATHLADFDAEPSEETRALFDDLVSRAGSLRSTG